MSMMVQVQAKSASMSSFTPVRSNLLQRKCACGDTPSLDGECAECRRKRLNLKRCATSQPEPSTAPSIVHDELRSPGQPLDPSVRAYMEARFGHDFSRVRVHTDARAAESARAVDALAYTVGQNVVFGRGQYNPATIAGRQLLAHELTHTLQQGEALPASQEGLIVSAPGDAAEWQADQAARLASWQGSREPAPHPLLVSSTGSHLARQPEGGNADPQAEARMGQQKEAEKGIDADLALAQKFFVQATAIVDEVAKGELDTDLVDGVRAQGESVQETIELLTEFKSLLAAMPDEQRKVMLGFGAIELQLYVRNAEHLRVLNKIVSWTIPEAVSNQDEVEERLEEYATWHESWIEANEEAAELAADFLALLSGEEKIQANRPAAENLGEFHERLAEEGQALAAVNDHVDEIIHEGKEIETKARRLETLQMIAEVISSLRGRRMKLKGPPRSGGRTRPGGRSKGGAKTKQRATRTRKQFKKTKGGEKPKKAKERREKRKKRKEKRAAAYPICWAWQLEPPMLAGVPVPGFVRTPGVAREPDVANQQRAALRYRETVDPGFRAGAFHVHHSVPLFLGGLDSPMNMTLIEARTHLRGHQILAHQPQMVRPPGGLKPLPTNLYNHPAGTRYRLKGYKTEANQTC